MKLSVPYLIFFTLVGLTLVLAGSQQRDQRLRFHTKWDEDPCFNIDHQLPNPTQKDHVGEFFENVKNTVTKAHHKVKGRAAAFGESTYGKELARLMQNAMVSAKEIHQGVQANPKVIALKQKMNELITAIKASKSVQDIEGKIASFKKNTLDPMDRALRTQLKARNKKLSAELEDKWKTLKARMNKDIGRLQKLQICGDISDVVAYMESYFKLLLEFVQLTCTDFAHFVKGIVAHPTSSPLLLTVYPVLLIVSLSGLFWYTRAPVLPVKALLVQPGQKASPKNVTQGPLMVDTTMHVHI